jgi:hypothetical protein
MWEVFSIGSLDPAQHWAPVRNVGHPTNVAVQGEPRAARIVPQPACDISRPQTLPSPPRRQGLSGAGPPAIEPTSANSEQTPAVAVLRVQSLRSVPMGIFTKDIKSMEDLFLHQLEDIYYAEQQLTKAIPT